MWMGSAKGVICLAVGDKLVQLNRQGTCLVCPPLVCGVHYETEWQTHRIGCPANKHEVEVISTANLIQCYARAVTRQAGQQFSQERIIDIFKREADVTDIALNLGKVAFGSGLKATACRDGFEKKQLLFKDVGNEIGKAAASDLQD